MNNKISYTERNVFLIGVIVIVCYLVAVFGVSPTSEKITKSKEQEAKLLFFSDVTPQKVLLDSSIERIKKEIRLNYFVGNIANLYLQGEIDTLMRKSGIKNYKLERNKDIGFHHALMSSFELSVLLTYSEVNELVALLNENITTARISSVRMSKIRTQPGAPKLMKTYFVFQQVNKEDK